MALRFNTPPDWPTPPDGWLPPAGWRPDPSWPAAPLGWIFLIEDLSSSAAPVAPTESTTAVDNDPTGPAESAEAIESPIEDGEVGGSRSPAAEDRQTALSQNSRRPPKWTAVISISAAIVLLALIGGVLAVLGLSDSATTDSNKQINSQRVEPAPSPTPAMTLSEQMDAALRADVSEPACQRLAGGLQRIQSEARAQRKASAVAADPRAARDFVASHAWARRTAHHLQDERSVIHDQVGAKASAIVVDGQQADEPDYVTRFLAACDLVHLEASTRSVARQADRAVTRLRTVARNAPWWPLGYSKLTSNVAFEFLSHDSYSCDLFPCVQARFVAKKFCGTLYVEMNIEDAAGQVIDYSNDDASNLNAGQVAVLEFVSTDDNAVRFGISDVSCY